MTILGGVLLFAGMELAVAAKDQRDGNQPVRFLVHHIVEVQDAQWVILEGQQHPSSTSCWRSCRLAVRISALKRSLTLGD